MPWLSDWFAVSTSLTITSINSPTGLAGEPSSSRAGLERSLTFHDLRTTALTNMGNKGATMAEIVSFSGHKLNSPVLETYVKPGREAAIRALNKLETNGE